MALGNLLELLHDADLRSVPVQATYSVWRHRERAHAAFVADIEERRRRGASIGYSQRRGERPDPVEQEETIRIWRSAGRVRVEHHGGDRDGDYEVVDGPLWWVWHERTGARSNENDPSIGGRFGDELTILLDPVPLLGALRFRLTGTSEVAGRPTITALGSPRGRDSDHGPGFELHQLGTGADRYELEIDRQFGVLLACTAVRDGQPFQRITTTAIRLGHDIPDDVFRFRPPPGEEILPLHDEHRLLHVTLVEAQQQAPFTVLMPDTVPASWQVRCRLIRPSRRPPSPMQIGLSYTSVDGHESLSLSQAAAGASNPDTHLGDDEGWERVTRGEVVMRTRPAHWGQAQVELERHGTYVHLMSDNLIRDQLLSIADGLRPAPDVSEI